MSEKKSTVKIYKERTGAKPSERVTKLVKEQARIKSKILNALKSGAKTVPEIAEETGLDGETVMWYLMTFLRLHEVEAVEKNEEGYYRYRLIKGR